MVKRFCPEVLTRGEEEDFLEIYTRRTILNNELAGTKPGTVNNDTFLIQYRHGWWFGSVPASPN